MQCCASILGCGLQTEVSVDLNVGILNSILAAVTKKTRSSRRYKTKEVGSFVASMNANSTLAIPVPTLFDASMVYADEAEKLPHTSRLESDSVPPPVVFLVILAGICAYRSSFIGLRQLREQVLLSQGGRLVRVCKERKKR